MPSTSEVEPTPREGALDTPGPRIWGLDVVEIHDAFWRSQGVQCVRREEDLELQAGSDLFMLMEPGQCAVFDLTQLANAMVWNQAPLSRIRVMDTRRSYVERIVVNPNDELVRVSREYGDHHAGSCRVLLTRRPSLAQAWSECASRRQGWTELRRYIDWTRTDQYRIDGTLADGTNRDRSLKLLDSIVASWKDPSRAIEGVRELMPGVWGLEPEQLGSISHIISPAWIGFEGGRDRDGMLIGPCAALDEGRIPPERRLRMIDVGDIRSGAENRRVGIRKPELTAYLLAKRLIDMTVSFLILLALSPILLVVAIAVVADDGWPIFFGHKRQTRGGREFKCWKFRTMLNNAEAMVKDLQSDNLADGPQVFIRDDPRITRIGKVLRRFHLDELPQFWNVLTGDMSLVGPRPSPDKENQFCPAWREARLSVRPGITGLWQVERTRAPGLDFQEWIRYDIEYVNKASLLLDAKICIKTIQRTISG